MAAPSGTQKNWYAWYVVAVLTLANISGFVDSQILTLLVQPIEKRFGITDTQMSYLGGLAFAAFYSTLGIPIARWADRSSRRNIMGGGVALWSIFTSACAVVKTFGGLMLMRIGVGVGEATLQAPSVSLLADYFPRERLSRAMSVYSLGIFLGSGLAYYVGGVVVGLIGKQESWTLPVIGTIEPWQSIFLAVGLPGMLVTLLFLTVREPARRNVDQAGRYLPFRALIDYVMANKTAYLTHGVGFAISGAVNFALAFWIPTFFIRTFHWQVQDAGRVQGLLTMSIGVVGVLAGGRTADWFVARGKLDGPLRVGIIGAIGMLISATTFALAPTASIAVAALGVVNFFAAFPWGAAAAAAAEMAPIALRAQGAALYFFLLNLISRTLGPTSVALFNDHVFGADGIGYSIAVVNVIGMAAALILFIAGLRPYRRALEYRESWGAS